MAAASAVVIATATALAVLLQERRLPTSSTDSAGWRRTNEWSPLVQKPLPLVPLMPSSEAPIVCYLKRVTWSTGRALPRQ